MQSYLEKNKCGHALFVCLLEHNYYLTSVKAKEINSKLALKKYKNLTNGNTNWGDRITERSKNRNVK